MHTGEFEFEKEKKKSLNTIKMRVETNESACDTQRQGKTPTNNRYKNQTYTMEMINDIHTHIAWLW